MKFTIEAG